MKNQNEFLPDCVAVGDGDNQVGGDVKDNIDDDNPLADVATPNETPNKNGAFQGNVIVYLLMIGSSFNDVFTLKTTVKRSSIG